MSELVAQGRKIHVNDSGDVEFCLADNNCPFGAFENVSEALEHFQNRQRRRAPAPWPRGWKGRARWESYSYVLRNPGLHPEMVEYARIEGWSVESREYDFLFTHKKGKYSSFTVSWSRRPLGTVREWMKRPKHRMFKRLPQARMESLMESAVTHFNQPVVYSNRSGYAAMMRAYNDTRKNFELRRDANWNSVSIGEYATLSIALEHAKSRLDGMVKHPNLGSLTLQDDTVSSFMDLCAEILYRTNLLADQTVAIFGSNDDQVHISLMAENIPH